ncbi:MAG: ABC transporter substrate-binding protein [Acidobacteriota bacterium]|nr:ABC transporter substrate-binding protein [Acidobacteriota bacterium]
MLPSKTPVLPSGMMTRVLWRRRVTGWRLALVLAIAVSSAPVGGADRVVVAALPFVSSAPVFIAHSRGFYADEGLDVELRFFHAAQPVALAVAARDADFGVTGLTAGFFNLVARGAVKIVAGQARVQQGYQFVAYLASPDAHAAGLRTPADLAGRRVGITQMGSTFHYMVGQAADHYGFPLERVRLVPLESVASTIAALRGGSIDAILLPSHLARPLADAGSARIIGWASEVEGWQLGALFASTRTVEDRPDVARRFLAAYRRGAAVYHETFLARGGGAETEAAADALAGELSEFVPSTVAQIRLATPFIPADGGLDLAAVHRHVKWFQTRGLVDRQLQPDALFASLSGSR